MAGMHILTVIIPAAFEGRTALIEVRGKHLDNLGPSDKFCIGCNKCLTALFVYHCVRTCWHLDTLAWGTESLTPANTVGSLVALYVVYDFFYTLLHRFLHLRSVYPLVHKHHHKQKAPSRGNLDAINVHPLEFLLGEYLHLLAIWLVPCHAMTAAAFVVLGGVLASLNHTRFDVSLFGLPLLYTVKNHDVHHRLPESNYGQYLMLWDRLMGSFRPYTDLATKAA